MRSDARARQAWYRHARPLLFDQVREGVTEPTDLRELVRWLEAERERQAGLARWVAAQLGHGFPYEVPDAVDRVLAACAERLAA